MLPDVAKPAPFDSKTIILAERFLAMVAIAGLVFAGFGLYALIFRKVILTSYHSKQRFDIVNPLAVNIAGASYFLGGILLIIGSRILQLTGIESTAFFMVSSLLMLLGIVFSIGIQLLDNFRNKGEKPRRKRKPKTDKY